MTSCSEKYIHKFVVPVLYRQLRDFDHEICMFPATLAHTHVRDACKLEHCSACIGSCCPHPENNKREDWFQRLADGVCAKKLGARFRLTLAHALV
jgi:hypothetical protein